MAATIQPPCAGRRRPFGYTLHPEILCTIPRHGGASPHDLAEDFGITIGEMRLHLASIARKYKLRAVLNAGGRIERVHIPPRQFDEVDAICDEYWSRVHERKPALNLD